MSIVYKLTDITCKKSSGISTKNIPTIVQLDLELYKDFNGNTSWIIKGDTPDELFPDYDIQDFTNNKLILKSKGVKIIQELLSEKDFNELMSGRGRGVPVCNVLRHENIKEKIKKYEIPGFMLDKWNGKYIDGGYTTDIHINIIKDPLEECYK